MPTPLRPAAMVPATWVPWSLVVGCQAAYEVSGVPLRQPAERPWSMLAARSGWSPWMPESSTATSTFFEPSVTWWAWSALMAVMSHWRASSGSAVTAVAASRPSCSTTDCCEAEPPVRCRAAVSGAPFQVGSEAATGAVRVAPTEATDLSARTEAAKFTLSDCAMTTPISGHDATTVPAAAVTARSAFRVWPLLAFVTLTA